MDDSDESMMEMTLDDDIDDADRQDAIRQEARDDPSESESEVSGEIFFNGVDVKNLGKDKGAKKMSESVDEDSFDDFDVPDNPSDKGGRGRGRVALTDSEFAYRMKLVENYLLEKEKHKKLPFSLGARMKSYVKTTAEGMVVHDGALHKLKSLRGRGMFFIFCLHC